MQGIHYDMYFYKDGFFGYGEKGEFVQWSLAHFAPIVVSVVAIVLIWLFRDRLRAWRYEKQARFFYGFVMFLFSMGYYWRLLYVGTENLADVTFMDRLPLEVCEWTMMISMYALYMKSEILFDMTYFLTLSTSILPLLFPAVLTTTGPTYFRYYQYWLEHLMPIVGMFYLMFVHDMRPHKRGIALVLGMLVLLAIPATKLNSMFRECNYLYLKPGEYEMLSFLPNSPLVMMGLYTVVLIPLMSLAWLAWKLTAGRKSAE